MKTFVDGRSRSWGIALTFGSIKRVLDLTGLDLLKIDKPAAEGEDPLLTRLGTNVVDLVNVVTALVRPELGRMCISDEDFAEALGGEAITGLHDAFWEELAAFFQSLRRADTAQAIAKQLDLVRKTVAATESRIVRINPDLIIEKQMAKADEMLEKLNQSTAGESSGSRPESPASTPSPSPGASSPG